MSGVTQLLLAAARTYPPLTADASPNSQSWVVNPGLGYITSENLVCAAGGGSGVYTYAWEKVTGNESIVFGDQTAASTNATDAGNLAATFRCTVSDDAGSTPVTSDTISVDP